MSKVFVGGLPSDITDVALRSQFGQYGQVQDVFVKPGCEIGRQWAFVTFGTPEQAQLAKESCDRILVFPGAERACEVMLAKNQGQFGQGALGGGGGGGPMCGGHMGGAHMGGGHMGGGHMGGGGYAAAPVQGPIKIFVGSLPDFITEQQLRAEFSRFGHITEVFIKTGCEPGRQWGFVTFQTPAEAQYAKESTDRVLVIPGHDRACEVTLARNQGKFGQEPLHGGAAPAARAPAPGYAAPPAAGGFSQPPPPTAPPPSHLTPWRMYNTAAGLPYYHNHTTGLTQWECPPELQAPGAGAYRPY